MMRQESHEQYVRALRTGQKHYRDCVHKGLYPYPQVLDEILDDSMVANRLNLGVIEIPIEKIVGTKTLGRQNAFAADFSPLLGADTEFASKWMLLCDAHLSSGGIRDPIRCCEYLGRFYVQEGNKRVSVLKSYGAATIPAYVTRLIPVWSKERSILNYYEFMESYQQTGLYRVYFSHPGSFQKLQAELGYEPDHVWTEDERRHFLAGYTYFREAFLRLGGNDLAISAADALLVWLRFYSFDSLRTSTAPEILRALTSIWPDVKALDSKDPIEVSTGPEAPDGNALTRWMGSVFLPSHLTVAFINERTPEESPWAAAHDMGRQFLEQTLGDRVTVHVYNEVTPGETADVIMELAVAEGAQVIFATTPPLIDSCRRIAARYPDIKVLNCSVSMPYTGVRTYYSRIHEGKFISGAIAGAVTRSDTIGYVASAPIFGTPASINAFALGARLTNPRCRIKVEWSCCHEDALERLLQHDIDVVSNRDIPSPNHPGGSWGTCQVQTDGSLLQLASPYWKWGSFYVKVVESIFNGSWDAHTARGEGKAVNYWWGMSSGVVDMLLTDALSGGVRQLAQLLQRDISNGSLFPFHRLIHDQQGQLRNDGSLWYTAEEILSMDWLCDCIDGSIPAYDELLPMAKPLARLLAVYRDSIPPIKEGMIP